MPSQAQIFETYMRGVWDNALTRDGNDVYDTDHNACDIAQAFGAKPLATGEEWTEWLFADGSTTWIMNNGNGISNALP